MDTERTDAWREIGNLRVGEGGRSTLPSPSSTEDRRRLDIAARKAFAAELTPCLALVSGTGMSADDRREWLSAAYRAIGHYPGHILATGVAAAMKEADHPSKIVPAITRAAEPLMARERAVERMVAGAASQAALPAPGDERCTRAELDAITKRHGVGRYSGSDMAARRRDQPPAVDPDRACRAPTRADYLRLGVTPDVLDGLGLTDGVT